MEKRRKLVRFLFLYGKKIISPISVVENELFFSHFLILEQKFIWSNLCNEAKLYEKLYKNQ